MILNEIGNAFGRAVNGKINARFCPCGFLFGRCAALSGFSRHLFRPFGLLFEIPPKALPFSVP